MIRDIRKYKVILLFLIVYFSCNSFVLAIKFKSLSTTITIAVVLLVGMVSLIKGCNHISQSAWGLVLLSGLNILFTSFVNGYMNGYMLLFLELLLALACIRLYTRREFLESYIFVMKLLAVYAIVIGIINATMPSLLNVFTTYISSNREIYYDAIFAFQLASTQRINSIWGEPGMLSVFLIFAIAFECFYVDRPINYFTFTVLTLAEVLTFSSAGYVCLALIMAATLVSANRGSNERKVASIMLVACIILYFAIENVAWMQTMIQGSVNKLTNSDDLAFIGRLAPILYNMQEGVKSPFWGNGMEGQGFYVDFSFYSGILYCNTSTTTYLFNVFGIIISSISVYLTWRLIKLTKQRGLLFRILLFIVLILNVNAQAVHIDQVYWIILFLPFMWNSEQCDEYYEQYE